MSSATRTERSRPRSILLTIIVLMTAVMSVLILAFATFQLTAAATAQERDHEQYISTTLHFIRAELEGELEEGEYETEELEEIEDVVLRENTGRRFGRLMVDISDEDGTPLLETAGARQLLKENPTFPPTGTNPGATEIAYWESSSGFRFVLAQLRTSAPDGRRRQVRIALDWTDAAHKAEALRRNSIGAALLCATLAAIAAALVTRHALRPLEVIRDAAESIREGSFDVRLEPDRLPAEVSDLAQSFENMQSHLKESFEKLSQFAAELAHELRTPVNNLMGQTEVVLAQDRSSDEYREVLESNLEEMARLSRMIDSLLFLAHAARGSGRGASERLSLGDEVDRVIEYHRAQADDLGVELRREGNATALVDRTLIRRALSNLLSNAIQASIEGGLVVVDIAAGDAETTVSVRDQGVGIPPEDLPRVFERFHRSQDSRTRRPDGSGLGLAIVKSIADLHGGRVTIESTPGRGTAVTLHLPARG